MGITKIEFEKQETKYRLFFNQLAYDKMRLYVDLCSDEIGWLGYVDKLPDDNGYLVTDVFLIEQEVHGTTTEITPEGMLKYYDALSPEEQAVFVDKCKLWGHSHVNMNTGPSGQDDTQGLELSKDEENFFIRLITNKRNEYNILFYDKTIRAQVHTDEITIYNPELAVLRKQIQEEIDEKVSKKEITPITSTSGKRNYDSAYWNRLTYTKDTEESSYKTTVVTNKKEKSISASKLYIADIFDKADYELAWL